MTSPYRTSPPTPPQPPRASWWRRLWHRGVAARLDVRRLRLWALADEPRATWTERNDLAREAVAYVRIRPWLRTRLRRAIALMLRGRAERHARVVEQIADAVDGEERTSWACT